MFTRHSRVVSFILCVVLAAAVLSGAAVFAAEDTAEETAAVQAAEIDEEVRWLLEETQIFTGGEEPDALVTRGTFARYAVRLQNIDPGTGSVSGVFNDLSDSEDRPYIEMAYQLGFLAAPEDGAFRPHDPITYTEAVKLLVCAAGYQYLAEANGGYPTGYLQQAVRTGIAPSGVETETVTYALAAELLYQTLKTDVVRQTQAGTTSRFDIVQGQTVLKEYFSISEGQGLMDGNAYGGLNSIAGGKTGEGQVSIDGVCYRISDTAIADRIGETVSFYMREEEGADLPELLWAVADPDKNTVVNLNPDEIEDVTKEAVEYYMNEGKVRREVRLEPSTSVLYNGRYWNKIAAAELTPENIVSTNGVTTFVDNDKDGVTEVIKIEELRHFLVSVSSAENNAVYDKLSGDVFLADEIEDLYIKLKYGPEIQLSELKENDVIAIKMPKESADERITHAEIYVVNDTITTVPESILDGGEEVVLDGETYRLSQNYLSYDGANTYTPKIEPGVKYQFYLGYSGEIEAAAVAAAGESLAYLIAVSEDGGPFDKTVGMKVFDIGTKTIQIYNLAERVTFVEADTATEGQTNTTTAKTADEKLAKLRVNGETRNELMRISQNADGDISKITLATRASHGFNKQQFSGWAIGFTLGSRYVAKPTTRILMVPPDMDNASAYSIIGRDGYTVKEYTLDLYEINEFYQYNYAVMRTTSGGNVEYDAPIFAVESIISALDENGDPVKKLVGYYDGVQKELIIPDEGITSAEFSTDQTYVDVTAGGLRFGDLIQISETSGQLIGFRLLYRYEPGATDEIFLKFCDQNTNTAYIPNNDFTFGKSLIQAVSEEVVTIENNGTKSLLMNKYDGFSNVYIFDTDRKLIRLGLPSDLVVGEYVLTGWRWAWCMDAVVYR